MKLHHLPFSWAHNAIQFGRVLRFPAPPPLSAPLEMFQIQPLKVPG